MKIFSHKHLKQNLSLGILFLFLFVFFTFLVRTDVLRSFDFNMTVKLQDRIPLSFDTFFSTLSVLGRFEYTLVFLAIFLIFRHKIVGGFITIGLFAFAHLLELVGKSFLEQPGPPRMFLRSQFGDFPGLHIFTEASYPSGHAMRTIFLGILFLAAIYFSKKLPHNFKMLSYGVVLFFVIIILVSRVSLGEHWTTDVIGGALLGASFSFFSLLFL